MRPSHILLTLFLLLILIDTALYFHAKRLAITLKDDHAVQAIAVAGLGLTDLCVATEARYTRHPAVTDPMAPFMDHPGAIEHFPSGSFWNAPIYTNTR
ncbi:MAG: hypothetical protein AMJ61_04050 [Desulfobacterales bacterium SG8_35_2]|jgi:hypothetical protein|nr:MAG: hypothetical protein AMJ61_04050 [Desulfobacterales bacterium SG8_35_2]